MACDMEELIEKHAGLVKSIALRLAQVYGEEADDLIQIGYIGLIKAIKGFDKARGFKFSTYAVPLITGEIKSQMRDTGRIKMSRSLKADMSLIRKAENNYILKKGQSPRVSELTKATGLDEERIKQVLQAYDVMQNIEDYEKIDLMTNDEEKNIIKIDLAHILNKLEPQERKIMI